MNLDFNKLEKEKYIKELNMFFDRLINERNSFAGKLKNYNKDEHIAKLIKYNDNLRVNSLHVLSDKEKEEADSFKKEHWERCRGNVQYILRGTGLGTAVAVQCLKCDTRKDITDTDNW